MGFSCLGNNTNIDHPCWLSFLTIFPGNPCWLSFLGRFICSTMHITILRLSLGRNPFNISRDTFFCHWWFEGYVTTSKATKSLNLIMLRVSRHVWDLSRWMLALLWSKSCATSNGIHIRITGWERELQWVSLAYCSWRRLVTKKPRTPTRRRLNDWTHPHPQQRLKWLNPNPLLSSVFLVLLGNLVTWYT